jgi:hypothetical protein
LIRPIPKRIFVHCTDPLSVIDIPNLIRETGDKVLIPPLDTSAAGRSY